jgi:hypothetical protein
MQSRKWGEVSLPSLRLVSIQSDLENCLHHLTFEWGEILL